MEASMRLSPEAWRRTFVRSRGCVILAAIVAATPPSQNGYGFFFGVVVVGGGVAIPGFTALDGSGVEVGVRVDLDDISGLCPEVMWWGVWYQRA